MASVAPHEWSTSLENILIPRLLERVPFSEFVRLAETGNSQAQWLVGQAYLSGRAGVPQDFGRGVAWVRRSAEQDNARGQISLGRATIWGIGMASNPVEAAVWYRRAAVQGNAIAEDNLGTLYYRGRGIEANYAEALAWFRRAAAQGYGRALAHLGEMYDNGDGVPNDHARAVSYYQSGAELGDAVAETDLAANYDEGGASQDFGLAMQLYRQAAGQGYFRAQRQIGFMYQGGVGVEQNYPEAARWFRLAADNRDYVSEYALGVYLFDGRPGVPINSEEGLARIRRSAASGYVDARNWLSEHGFLPPS